ncbi:HlyD family efflux transporter periplasmic adaptor subunit [Amycolatopsis sp. K13G38]|uniref:HlyD family efflux transporter periplasmic adaptor subunit n=1 Tax=Amycolatopsis acididurans TaxID=2724524 RepID=A0ABX1JHD1_9PSEU|nr:HlyD family efflux transporter periplasmic adaptor subunit [Amycolatopsis acididurans]NKQ57961.1 HlyD family efflux transporter periplasmic adaptor subunit [Amycolatopsis acididurans]
MAKRAIAIAIAGAVVVVAGGVVFWTTSASSSPGYRTAVAGPAPVTATLDTAGTIQAVTQAALSFPTSGLVSAVDVAAGQQVTAGQPLAQLDTTSLAGQVASAQSTLATAQARLAADQSGQSTAASSRATPAVYLMSASAPSDLKSQQDAVTSAQHQVDEDLTAASAAVSAQQKACQPVMDAKQPSDQNTVDACTSAIQQAQNAQHTTAVDEQKLADAENTLSATLAANAAASKPVEPTPSTPAPSTRTPSAQTPSTKAPSNSAPSGGSSKSSGGSQSSPGTSGSTKTSTPASAEQLAADQAAIDAANAQIAVAQQNLAAATLVSPITGTVGEVGFSAGKNASNQQHIVVFGPGANQVSTAVSDTQAGQIKPGQRVSVTPDGSGKPIDGQVVSIGLLSSTTSSGSPSYPVTVSLPASTELHQGATAAVSIITNTANAAVTVPTSAVHLVGGGAFVETLSGGATSERRVTLGVVGASTTEVTSGLKAGDEVVLADLSQALPTSNTNARGLVGGGGGGAVRRGG